MKTELLVCRRLTAGVVYPPMQLNQQQVNRVYADITERYPFQTLQHLPDGARMANPTGDFFIQTTRMQVNDHQVDYFQNSKEKAVDLFRLAQERIKVPQFVTFGIKLTAILPVGEGTAAQLIENSAVKSIKDNIELLGPGLQGVGLRFVLHQDGVRELKIEPLFTDVSQLYVELDVQHPAPFSDILSVESRMDAAYDYLFREVQGFLETL